MPQNVGRIDIQTAQQMYDSVLNQFPSHDLLIIAAAVCDYRPKSATSGKIEHLTNLTLELESTPDILAAAGK